MLKNSAHSRWLFFLLSFLGVLLLAGVIVFYVARVYSTAHLYGNTDFYKFYQAVRFYFAGENIYTPVIIYLKLSTGPTWVTANGNLNPPFLTLLLMPLYFFNYARAMEIWVYGYLCCVLFSLYFLLHNGFRHWNLKLPQKIWIAAGFLLYVPNSIAMTYGQVTAYILLILTAVWLLARARRDVLAGVFIGLACSIKLFCGLFFVYFLILRRGKLLVSAGITYVVTLAAGLIFFGRDAYQQYHQVLQAVNWYAASWNASFLGFFMRLLSPVEHNKALWNLPKLAYPLTIILSIILLAYLLFFWHKIFRAKNIIAEDMGFGLTLIAMLLLSPLGWVYYFGFLLIAYLIYIDQTRYIKSGVIWHIAGCLVIFLSSLATDFLKTNDIKTYKQIFADSGYGFYALILFFILLACLAHQRLKNINNNINIYKHHASIALPLWLLIYACVLTPSVISMGKIASRMLS